MTLQSGRGSKLAVGICSDVDLAVHDSAEPFKTSSVGTTTKSFLSSTFHFGQAKHEGTCNWSLVTVSNLGGDPISTIEAATFLLRSSQKGLGACNWLLVQRQCSKSVLLLLVCPTIVCFFVCLYCRRFEQNAVFRLGEVAHLVNDPLVAGPNLNENSLQRFSLNQYFISWYPLGLKPPCWAIYASSNGPVASNTRGLWLESSRYRENTHELKMIPILSE